MEIRAWNGVWNRAAISIAKDSSSETVAVIHRKVERAASERVFGLVRLGTERRGCDSEPASSAPPRNEWGIQRMGNTMG